MSFSLVACVPANNAVSFLRFRVAALVYTRCLYTWRHICMYIRECVYSFMYVCVFNRGFLTTTFADVQNIILCFYLVAN